MNRSFYPRLAFINMKKHSKTYIPYLLSTITTVSMFYILTALTFNKDLINKFSSSAIVEMLVVGIVIVVIFSCIFIFYTNSFLTKRRKKEIGLYNILGMQKRHIMCMLLFENMYTMMISIISGVLFGIIFGKILFLLLLRIVYVANQDAQFPISLPAISLSIVVFIPIFLATLLSNIWKIHFSNPITLLQGGNTGEKEPKARWILTIIGIACLGPAYYIGQSINEPVHSAKPSYQTILLLFIGTYPLFIGVSISILKFLKHRKRFYYKTNHFTIVSGMLYRMKQNAVGLANICVLSTLIIFILTTTASLYFGINDRLDFEFPYKNSVVMSWDSNSEKMEKSKQIVQQDLLQHHIAAQDETQYRTTTIYAKVIHNKILAGTDWPSLKSVKKINILTLEDYNALHDRHVTLQPNEVLWLNKLNAFHKKTDFTINTELFSIKEYVSSDKYAVGKEDYNIVVANDQVMEHIHTLYESFDAMDQEFTPTYIYAFNTQQNARGLYDIMEGINDKLQQDTDGSTMTFIEYRENLKQQYLQTYGGLLFIGIFFGILFLLATTLIIYYKQISEGYEDRERYQIMQKVGMSTSEIKKSIRFQVLSIFLLPILIAIIHFSFAFKIITSLLYVLQIRDITVFLSCSSATIFIFLVFYLVVYLITSRVYYKIIK